MRTHFTCIYLKYVCVCCRNDSQMRRNTSNSNFSMPVFVYSFFSLIFVPFNLCVFFSCVTSFDSIFYCNFWCENVDAKREKVLIKPESFLLFAQVESSWKNVRKCKHITWLFIWWFWPFNLSSILSFRCCCFFAHFAEMDTHTQSESKVSVLLSNDLFNSINQQHSFFSTCVEAFIQKQILHSNKMFTNIYENQTI